VGIAVGLVIEALRKLIRMHAGYQRLVAGDRPGRALGFVVDAIVLPSPYALSFGGFVNLPTSLWFGAGGVVASLLDVRSSSRPATGSAALPPDMSGTSLFGGGLISGDALAALALGAVGLLAALAGS
jgi:hypothetical protein